MKKVLITGENSYVGSNIREKLSAKGHSVEEIEVRTNKYQMMDFSLYDTIIHVAAIVHKKEAIPWETYHQVNTLLPIDIAQRAKAAGVSQFIFFSTMGVYGLGKALPHGNVIQGTEPLNPQSDYSKSKYIAEQELQKLEDENFRVVIVRPPSIYGKNCPGNYIETFKKIAEKLPIFPFVYQGCKQSFLYIDNLAEFIRLCIETNASGIFHPQDATQVSTVELLQIIARVNGNRIHFSRLLGIILRLFSKLSLVNKLYGGIAYAPSLSDHFDGNYRLLDLPEAFETFMGR